MEEDPLSLVGTTIDGRYEIERLAGVGGTAVVYRARHTTWNRAVAIKVVRTLGVMSEAHRVLLSTQLEQEANLLASLSGKTSAIVQARDIGHITTTEGAWLPYLALEWLDGETLEALLERDKALGATPRTIEAAIQLLDPIAHALALAHRAGVAHRDVKPANLFVVANGQGDGVVLKLLDFGIAKVVADVYAKGGGFTRTQGGFTAFTPVYAAPEQFSRTHGPTGPWTDVFALALVLSEIVTGHEALVGDDVVALAASASGPIRPSLARAAHPVSPAVAEVFARAVAVDPGARFQDAGEFWRALRAASGLDAERSSYARWSTKTKLATTLPLCATLPDPMESTRAAPPPPPRKRRKGLFAVGAVTCLVSAIAIVSFASGKKDTVKPAVVPSAAPIVIAKAPSCPPGMITIDGGKFFMGSDDKAATDDEKPAHKVTLAPFCIDRTEVTVAAYKACSDRGDCLRAPSHNEWPDITDADRATYDPLCTIADPDGHASHPINCVDHALATAFCAAHDARLPTEAEWEFAARGPDGRVYPWGDDEPSPKLLNACGAECVAWGKAHKTTLEPMFAGDDGFAGTAPVGSFPAGASRYGLEDVVGNVWEWVADWHGTYDAADRSDPRGPASGTERVIRGGAWNGSYPAWVRPSFRFKNDPTTRSHGVGFRCAATPR